MEVLGDGGSGDRPWLGHDRRVLALLCIVFIDILSVGLVIPLIPFYAVELERAAWVMGLSGDLTSLYLKGADAQTIGSLGSFYGILQLFGSALGG
jgi:hypothetical protein